MSDSPLAIATAYARLLLKKRGALPAGQWMRKAAERFLSDLKAARERNSVHVYDDGYAGAAVRFIQLLPHIKGEWARRNETIKLEPWQVFLIANLFGFIRRADQTRRFRRAYLSCARKQGKSSYASAIGLYMLCGDGEPGAEVYALATTKDQAGIVYSDARAMVKKSPALAEHYGLDPGVMAISRPMANGAFKPLPGDPGDGQNPHCAIIDEYHEHQSPRAYDAMYSGMGARRQPLILVTTTAGHNRAGPCFALEAYCHRLLDGRMDDPSLFAAIFTLDPQDSWSEPKNWLKANPNLDVSVSRDNLAEACFEAQHNSVKQVNFLTKRMNIWVSAGAQWLDARDWDACADPSLILEAFAGRRAMIGLDLASKVDLCALEILIQDGPRWVRFGKYYLPEDVVRDGMGGSHAHFWAWHLDARLTLTPGNITDYGYIREDLLKVCRLLKVEAIAYDPYQATQLATELLALGLPMVEVPQNLQNLNEPMKELEKWVKAKTIAHDGCPVMAWQLSNVVAREDAKERVYPRKECAENKIDSPVALILAVGRTLVPVKPKVRSVYDLEAEQRAAA
jgi:phage terminase large subunit-like protein